MAKPWPPYGHAGACITTPVEASFPSSLECFVPSRSGTDASKAVNTFRTFSMIKHVSGSPTRSQSTRGTVALARRTMLS